jgi:intracellular sulfur oxidation DsrE/DsrF family protein
MNKINILLFRGIVFSFVICLFGVAYAYADGYEALNELNDIKVVFDVRSKTVKSAAIQLDLIHQIYRDKYILEVSKKPKFVVVFGGSSVKFVSTQIEEFNEEERFLLGQVAIKLSTMAKDGIKFEICLFAADLFDVESDTILHEIKQVENGWISLIGYQAKGYSLVAAF